MAEERFEVAFSFKDQISAPMRQAAESVKGATEGLKGFSAAQGPVAAASGNIKKGFFEVDKAAKATGMQFLQLGRGMGKLGVNMASLLTFIPGLSEGVKAVGMAFLFAGNSIKAVIGQLYAILGVWGLVAAAVALATAGLIAYLNKSTDLEREIDSLTDRIKKNQEAMKDYGIEMIALRGRLDALRNTQLLFGEDPIAIKMKANSEEIQKADEQIGKIGETMELAQKKLDDLNKKAAETNLIWRTITETFTESWIPGLSSIESIDEATSKTNRTLIDSQVQVSKLRLEEGQLKEQRDAMIRQKEFQAMFENYNRTLKDVNESLEDLEAFHMFGILTPMEKANQTLSEYEKNFKAAYELHGKLEAAGKEGSQAWYEAGENMRSYAEAVRDAKDEIENLRKAEQKRSEDESAALQRLREEKEKEKEIERERQANEKQYASDVRNAEKQHASEAREAERQRQADERDRERQRQADERDRERQRQADERQYEIDVRDAERQRVKDQEEEDARINNERQAAQERSFSGGFKIALEKLKEEGFNWARAWGQAFDSIQNGFSDAIQGMILEGMKFRDAMKKIGKQILASFVKMFSDFAAQQLFSQIFSGAGGAIGGLFKSLGIGGASTAATGATQAIAGAGPSGLIALPVMAALAGEAYLINAAASGRKNSAASGAAAGFMVGGPVGAVIGYVMGRRARRKKRREEEAARAAAEAAATAATEEAKKLAEAIADIFRQVVKQLRLAITKRFGGGLMTPEGMAELSAILSGGISREEAAQLTGSQDLMDLATANPATLVASGVTAGAISGAAGSVVVNAPITIYTSLASDMDVDAMGRALGARLSETIESAQARTG